MMTRAVFDANGVVSGFLSPARPHRGVAAQWRGASRVG